jgi:hypothetical protein
MKDFNSNSDKNKKLENNTIKESAIQPHPIKGDSLSTADSAYLSNSLSQVSPIGSEQSDCSPCLKNKRGSEQSDCSPCLKNKRGKVYKRSLETR